MSVTATQHPSLPSPRTETSTSPAQQSNPGQRAPAPAKRIRRSNRRGYLGPVPVANIVALELGFAVGLVLIALPGSWWYAVIPLWTITLAICSIRWRKIWLTDWIKRAISYVFRRRHHHSLHSNNDAAVSPENNEATNRRLQVMQLLIPQLDITEVTDHFQQPIGILHDGDAWVAVLQVKPPATLINQANTLPNLPLSLLASCLSSRDVMLDAIQVLWHCHPGSTRLPAESPVLASYLEILGPLPVAARRTTWIAMRLSPTRCADAISARGGGFDGLRRTLVSTLTRARSTLYNHGIPTKALDSEELLQACLSATELSGANNSAVSIHAKEKWQSISVGGINHRSYSVSDWADNSVNSSLNIFTSVRSLSASVSIFLSHHRDNVVDMQGVIRLSARTSGELTAADARLSKVAQRGGITLTPMHGLHQAGLVKSLPMGGLS